MFPAQPNHVEVEPLFLVKCATRHFVPTRRPVLFLTRVATVPGGLALRANLEVLQKAHNLTLVVVAKLAPLHHSSAKLVESVDWIMTPLPQPMYHAGQDDLGDVVPLRDPSRRGDPSGLLHLPNLAGVGLVSVHATGELQARVGLANFCGLAPPLHRPPLAPRDAAPYGLADTARHVTCCHLTESSME